MTPLREVGLARLRKICLALPETEEKEAWGDPTFRVRNKIFAMHKIGDGRPSLWCKSERYERDGLVEAMPAIFYVPPYVGPKGWIGVRLDVKALDWESVTAIVVQSYRAIAPKRLAATLGPPARKKPR
jgi:predicted DNA-binding protein (MmcQ/YjbR family)